MRKGILLAGGSGTRLMPITKAISKQMAPVYDKPMIYYSLSTLMLAGIRDILIISTPDDLPVIEKLFGDGSYLGISISYAVQERPEGIAQSFIIAEEFIDNQPVALILGDNIFYGHGLGDILKTVSDNTTGAHVFAYHVKDPERYGVVSFDANDHPNHIIEKPSHPISNWAVTGLYFYDENVVEIAKSLKPSERGELEITDVSTAYLAAGELAVERLGRGMAWLDAGTPESLLKAANFIQAVEERQGLKIGCIEEVAFHEGFIDAEQLRYLAEIYGNNEYGMYLRSLVGERLREVG